MNVNNSIESSPCNCSGNISRKTLGSSFSNGKNIMGAFPSVLLNLLIAFFPKCPFCWAVYMSMFGGLGLAKLPYLPWLLPVLMLFIGLHLFLLYKKRKRKGLLPFFVSLIGSLIVSSSRLFFPGEEFLLLIGMIMIITGSALNNFINLQTMTLFYR